jgi:hypothetical protein
MHTGVLFSFGYMLDLGNNFFLTPQLGAGASNFSPPEKESDKEGNDVSITLAVWAFGINLDIPLAGVDGQSYLRANLGYRTAITNIDIAKGGYTFFTIGYALFGRPSYRDL